MAESIITERFKEVLKERFGGKVAALHRACEEIGGPNVPSYGALRKHYGGSVPGLEQAAVIAKAAGVSLEWLAGMSDKKEPPPQDATGTHGVDTDTTKPISVKTGDVPHGAARRCLGYAFGAPGQEQLIIDFLIIDRDVRTTIPFERRDPNENAGG